MRRLAHRSGTLCLTLLTLAARQTPQVLRLNEAGKAADKAVAAAGVAGAAGLAAAAERGCFRAAAKVTVRETEGALAGGALRGGEALSLEELNASRLRPGPKPVGHDVEAFPYGRTRMVPRQPVLLPETVPAPGSALSSAVDKEVVFYDAHGNIVHKSGMADLQLKAQYHAKAHDILDEVLAETPADQLKDESALRAAVEQALKKQPPGKYDFNATTGKLALTIETKSGKITGEINAYSVVRTATTSGTGLWLGQQLVRGQTHRSSAGTDSGGQGRASH